MDTDNYLHHYPASLFSEKVRLLLGYRKTPTLQIGANIYCDTAVITAGLVRHTGDTTLYSQGFVANRVAEWADSTLFRTTVAINFRPEAIGAFMGQLSAEEVAAFQTDRAELAGGAPLVSVPATAAMNALSSYLTQLDRSLTNPFLFGDSPCIADFSVYHCLWFIDNPVNAELIDPHRGVRDWMMRMAGFGHNESTRASPEDALAHAKACDPVVPELEPIVIAGVAAGDAVIVTPTDYGQVPVTGRLIAASAEELVLERDDPDAGRLMTHFPNIGFDIRPA